MWWYNAINLLSQVQRGSAAAMMSLEQVPLIRYLVEQIRHFCKKPPKGFEKYFEEGKSAKPAAASEAGAAGKQAAPKTAENTSSAQKPAQQKSNEWNFGMFNNTGKQQSGGGGKGGQGRPIGEGGDGNREKMVIFGAIAAVGIIASLAFFEMGYKEISWKDFVTT